jgi:hypothetical protein
MEGFQIRDENGQTWYHSVDQEQELVDFIHQNGMTMQKISFYFAGGSVIMRREDSGMFAVEIPGFNDWHGYTGLLQPRMSLKKATALLCAVYVFMYAAGERAVDGVEAVTDLLAHLRPTMEVGMDAVFREINVRSEGIVA